MGDVMERERAIRERVAAAYCQPREAFATLVEWNNYLEEREDVAFNLVEGLDVARAEARLRAYSEKHADAIAKHQAEKAEEEAEAETRRMSYKMAGQVGEERQKGAEAGGGGGDATVIRGGDGRSGLCHDRAGQTVADAGSPGRGLAPGGSEPEELAGIPLPFCMIVRESGRAYLPPRARLAGSSSPCAHQRAARAHVGLVGVGKEGAGWWPSAGPAFLWIHNFVYIPLGWFIRRTMCLRLIPPTTASPLYILLNFFKSRASDFLSRSESESGGAGVPTS